MKCVIVSYLVGLTGLFSGCKAVLNTREGSRIVIPCASASTYPMWKGPSATGYIVYNYQGLDFANPALGEKKNRLSWDNKTNMIIDQVVRADSGKYSCYAINQTEQAVELVVRVKPQAIEISNVSTSPNMSIIQGIEGVELSLICVSSGGYPEQTVQWLRNGVSSLELNSTNIVMKENGSNTFNITQIAIISPSAEDDNIDYTCVSSFLDEPKLTVTTSAKLILQLKPSLPRITTFDNLKENENRQIARCETAGFRPSHSFTLHWLYHGTTTGYIESPVENSSKRTFSVSAIYQKSLTREDNGQNLTCSVSHQTLPNEISTSITLQVQFKPRFTRISGTDNIIANGVNSLTLTCTSGSSNPVSEMTWKVNDIIIQNNGQSSDLNGDYGGKSKQQQLILTPTRYNDGDRIACEVSNEVSEGNNVSDSKVLNLKFRPVINNFTNVIVTEGNFVLLECSASSKPPSTFRWYREGQSDQLYEGTGISNTNRIIYNMTFVRRNDTGVYRCNADNGIETADNKKLNLTVLYAPDVSVRKSVTTVLQNTPLSLFCDASGFPTDYNFRGFIHTFNGKFILSNHRTVIGTPSGSSLQILSAQLQDTGTYTCVVNNGVNKTGILDQKGSIDIEVQVEPVFFHGNVAIYGTIGENLVVTVPFYSFPHFQNITIMRSDGFEIVNNKNHEVTIEQSALNTKFYATDVLLNGTMINITFFSTTGEDFARYAIFVTNIIGYSSIEVTLYQKSAPFPPTHFGVEVFNGVLLFTWKRGLNGGKEQSFIIQSMQRSTEQWHNQTLVYETDEKHIFIDGLFFANLSYLPDGVYRIRIIAFNKLGNAEAVFLPKLVELKKQLKGEQDIVDGCTSVLIIGIILGSVIIVLVVCLILIIVKLRRLEIKQAGPLSSSAEVNQTEQPLYKNIAYNKDSDVQDDNATRTAKPNKDSQVNEQYSTLDIHVKDGASVYDDLNTSE